MTRTQQTTILHHLTAAARDIAVLGSVMGVIFGGMAYLTRPYWEPFAEMPRQVALIQRQIVEMQTEISGKLKPQIVSFRKATVTTETVTPGGRLALLYFLKRNAACETEVSVVFYNVDTNVREYGAVISAQRAPVTADYIPFPVTVPIPENMPPGRYVYVPTISPVDCGVYEDQRVMHSDIFRVVNVRDDL